MSAQYRIRVRGQLSPSWSRWFGGLTVDERPDGDTSIAGPLADQAALHGVLERIRDLGLVLVAVESVTVPADARDDAHPTPEAED
jgi:hypothetical protein